MKYKKYLMMFLAGTMALTPAAPMAALAEDTVPAAESEAAEEKAAEDTAEETADESEAEAEEAVEESEVKEAEAEEAEIEETAEEAEQAETAEQTTESTENETVAEQTMLLGATETEPVAEGETTQELAVGRYSVEYEIKDAQGEAFFGADVKVGNMIVDVSEGTDGRRVYTYYMTVQNTKLFGTRDFWLTKIVLADGEEAEVTANTNITAEDKQQEIPQVFKFERTGREDSLNIKMSTNLKETTPYSGTLAMDWSEAESGATIPGQEIEDKNQDLEVGVYSVEYGIMNASNPTNPSMAGGVQDGNMIVEVSKDNSGALIYTYYMTVKEMAVGTIKAHMVELKLGDENGESAEVYATTTLNEETVPHVFRFSRTEKEDQMDVTLVSSFMTAPAMIAIKWDTATTEGAKIPEKNTETKDDEIKTGVYSVEYGIMNASNPTNPSMAGGVQDGNMIVEVSKDNSGALIYTYYMTVKEMAVGTIKAHMVELKLGDENGESAEVYATTTLNEETVPHVFRFSRTEKEDQMDVTLVSSFMTAPAVIAIKWDTATTEGAEIPKGDSTPDTPDTATIPAPMIQAEKETAENGSEVEVSIATEKALTYGATKEIDGKNYTAVEVEVPNLQDDVVLTGYIDQMAAIPAMAARAWQSFRVVFDGEGAESGTVNVKYLKVGGTDASGVAPYLVSENLPAVKTENGYKLTLYVDAENISQMKDSQYKAAEIFYTTDGTAPTTDSEKYAAPFKVTGTSEIKTVKAIAVLDGKTSAVSEKSITFKKSSNTGKNDEITDGKYWMEVQFYNAEKDAVSMGDSALENNRRALVTIKNGTATIEVATNPIYRDGIVSGIGTIKSEDKDAELTVLDTNTNKEYNFEYVERFQIKLSDLTRKSVTVKFTVPNTPMESLYPDGVPARLMLDFSGMTRADDNASLKPNGSTASRSNSDSAAIDTEDKETGVKLAADKYVFEKGVELKVTKLTEAKDKKTAETLLKKQADHLDVYEIKVMKGNTEVKPAGTVKISIPVRDGETATKLYRITSADKKTDASATELEFTRSKDGKYLELEVKELGQFAVVYAEAGEEVPVDDATETPAAEENRTDISGHWAESMIQNAMQKGIMTGVGNGDFAPDAAMTRGMLITALGRMEGVKAGMYQSNGFADVKEDDYFAPFVAWAVAENVASGMSETEFAPNAEVTREQLAVFLYNYAQKKGVAFTGESKTFTDADKISDWAKNAVAALTKAGLLNGRPDGSFDAKGKATKAEVATVLVKFAELTAEK